MGAAKKCDVCGAYFDFQTGEDIINAFSYQHNDEAGTCVKSLRTYEICNNCVAAFNKLIKERKSQQ